VHGCCCALRAICGLCRQRRIPGTSELEAVISSSLKSEGVRDWIEEVITSYADYDDGELLEDAAAVFALTCGVEALFQRLFEEPSLPLRVAGLKALCEEGRADPELLSGQVAAAAIEACEKILREAAVSEVSGAGVQAQEPTHDTTRLNEVAFLLCGLCRGRLPGMPQLANC